MSSYSSQPDSEKSHWLSNLIFWLGAALVAIGVLASILLTQPDL